LEKETAIADIQKDIVKADQGVVIAERVADASVKKAQGEAQSLKLQAGAEAERVRVQASAESERIKLIANAEAEKISKTGIAEAEKILAIGKADAEAYKLAVSAMGEGNFTQLKITESIGKEKIKVMPDILITGGSNDQNGALSGLLGLRLMEEVGKKVEKTSVETINSITDKKE